MQTEKDNPSSRVHYRTTTVADVELFYREAGEPDKPVVLLLHGFPASSHMFRDLVLRLSENFHV
ncbi:MAG TPA: hypothetical protein VGE79_04070, partial [Niastella sp.]